MPTLSSNIVKREVASVRDVEEALARQALHGGDLATNLLEFAQIDERRLTEVIAESLGLEPAPWGELPRAAERVRRLVGVEIAQRYSVYAIGETEGRLLVAVSEPLPPEVASDLEFSLGLRLDQKAAALVRVRQAIARDYPVELDRRIAKVLARLAGRPEPHPSTPVEAGAGGQEGMPPRAPRVIALSSRESAHPTQEPPHEEQAKQEARAGVNAEPLGPPPEPSVAPSLPRPPLMPSLDLVSLARADRAQRAPKAQPRRLGPYTMAMAETDLLEAETRDDVIGAFFAFSAQYFEYSALFAVHGDLAEGRDAQGAGASRTQVAAIGVPLDLPSTLAEVVNAEQHRLTRLGTSGLDGTLLRDLQRRPGPTVLLLPVRVRNRTVLVLYGDHGEADVTLGTIGNVLSFAQLAATALERIIRRRKEKAREAPPQNPAPRTESQNPVPRTDPPQQSGNDRDERAATLAPGVQASTQSRPAPSAPIAPLRTPAPRMSSPPFARPVISVGPSPGSLSPAARSLSNPDAAAEEERSARPSECPALETVPVELEQTPLVDLTAVARELKRAPDSHDLSASETSLAKGGETWSSRAPAEPPPLPARGPSVPPLSRSLAYSARPLPTAGTSKELHLPAVIVDLKQDTESSVERLATSDEAAARRLVEIGAAAVPALVGAFPGPITAEPRRGVGDGSARASDCGPLLRVLARIGPKAAGALSSRSNDQDPTVRAWATRLLGEMPCLDSARAVARRFVDEDPEVRHAALAAGRMLENHANGRAVLAESLSEMLLDSTRLESLQMVIEAIADLREARAVPTLATLLAASPPEIQRAARWALVVLARTDQGDSAAAWQEWWRLNAPRHRIEWLIDALMHDNQEIRRAAGDELKNLTKEYFGYYDDLPPRERERAQKRYRDWWESKGKARFT